MPSTYTLNNGIELIATGEQSGTWGDTTNLNLGLVDTALDGQVTVTLPAAGTSGAPNALPISDGAASNGRNRLIIFADGGDLGATAFVQLTPNDAEKIVYIRNNLSGGRAIALFQGTYNAANDYEVPAGTTAVVFFNGGGAGAVAANVFNNAFFDSLRLGGVSVTAILDEDNMASDSATALATQQSIKAYVDAQVGANNELSEVLANGNTSGGNNIQMTTTDEVQFRDTALTIKSSVDGQLDIAADVELEIVAPTLDINASTAVTIDTTTLTMTGSVNVVGDLDVDNLNINGNSIISTNTDGNIALTPNGTGEVDISKVDIDGGTIDGTVIGGTTPAAISGTTGSFSGNLTVDTNTLFVDAANNRVGIGTSSPSNTLTVSSLGTIARFISSNTGAYIGLQTSDNSGNFIGSVSGATVFQTNDIERLRIDASGNVGIGTSSFAYSAAGRGLLEVNGSSSALVGLKIGDVAGGYLFDSGSLVSIGAPAGRSITFDINGERARIDASGNLGLGVTPSAWTTSGPTVFDIGARGALVDWSSAQQTDIWSNGYFNGTNSVYKTTANASIYRQSSGAHTWFTAPSGTAGNAITFSQAMTLDSSGNLLVGTTTVNPGVGNTATGVQAGGSILAASRSNNVPAFFNRNTSDGSIVEFSKDGTTVGSIAVDGGGAVIRNYWDVRSAASIGSGLGGNDGFIQPLNKSGTSDAQIDLGSSSSRFRDLYLSGGVFLGGTGSANLLDDYEEGTWTPSQGAGLTVVGAFSSSGTYTKVGRKVTVVFYVSGATSIAVSAGGIITDNLPFTVLSDSTGPVYRFGAAGGECIAGNTTLLVYNGAAISAGIGLAVTISYFV